MPTTVSDAAAPAQQRTLSPTRGFLFADLRGYTRFVEERGAAAAATLLERYRVIVREAVASFAGAEIRTEGDSFYVVFPAASAAVQCGLAIVERAGQASLERADMPIRVGIGVHAGETVETSEGLVGTPVNVAARICAKAREGEVLVSDTVRALTASVLAVRFERRGRQSLKGVAEPIVLYAVVPSTQLEPVRRRPWGRRAAVGIALFGGALLAGALAFFALRPPPGLPAGSWAIAVEMALSGDQGEAGGAVRDAVRMAIDEANASGGVGGYRLRLVEFDQGTDPFAAELFESNARRQVADASILAVIGPWNTAAALTEIPITNEAGLLQCSPAASDPTLTKPELGAERLRSAFPDRINFVRLATTEDAPLGALASFARHDLALERVLVVDDTQDTGREFGDLFSEAFEDLDGTVDRRSLNPGADPASVLDPLDSADPPGGVFFSGFEWTGGPELRVAMVAAGHGSLPFIGWEGIKSPAENSEGFIARAGAAAAGSYSSQITFVPPRRDFVERYRAAFGSEPPHEYVAPGYACAEIILAALREVAKTGPRAEELRELVRSHVADPSRRFETVVGTVAFDENGDWTQQLVTIYRVEPAAAGGKGDWVVVKQVNYSAGP